MATTGIASTFEIQLVGEDGSPQGWEVSGDRFIYVWIASEDQILVAEVANSEDGEGILTATYQSDFPGSYLVHVEEVVVQHGDEGRPIQNSPFTLTIVGEPTIDVNALQVCGTEDEDVEDSFWRPGTWVSSNIASEAHGVTRDGWVFQPKSCVHDTFSREDLLKLADLEEETWLLILGNSVFRGLYLTLVDMALAGGQKDDLAKSALQKCWGYADLRIGNLRVTYQDMRLYEFDTVEDSVVCNNNKLSAGSSAAFVGSCDKFLRATVFGDDAAGWPTVVVAPSYLVDSDESPNLAIEVVMEALPPAWQGNLLLVDHMAGLGHFWKQGNPTMRALHDVNPTPPFVRGRTIPTNSTRDNGIGRMGAYTERDPRVRFMSAFPMYQAKLFENEFYRNGMRHFGLAVHYHYVSESPKEEEANGGAKMVHSTMTEMFAHVVIGKAVGTKEALYDLDATTHYTKPRNGQIGLTAIYYNPLNAADWPVTKMKLVVAAMTATVFVFGGMSVVASTAVEANEDVQLTSNKTTLFTTEWVQEFGKDALSCTGPAEDPYVWREAGHGSNFNYLLLAWAAAIVEGRNDLSIIVNTDKFYSLTKCDVASNGVETRGGWPCIYAPMPHLCTFDDEQSWAHFNQQRGLSQREQERAADRNTVPYFSHQIRTIQAAIAGSDVDLIDVVARLYDYLNSHVQPWFKDDVQAILDEPDVAAVREGKYVGMHIRRGDKELEVQHTETKAYFETAAGYLAESPAGVSAADIRGIWLSTDEEKVLDEVKALAPTFFPNVNPKAIVCVTSRVTLRPMVRDHIEGPTDRNTYEATVLLRLELQMLAGADVFSGTFSSNLGRVRQPL
eukprot:g7398.t1